MGDPDVLRILLASMQIRQQREREIAEFEAWQQDMGLDLEWVCLQATERSTLVKTDAAFLACLGIQPS